MSESTSKNLPLFKSTRNCWRDTPSPALTGKCYHVSRFAVTAVLSKIRRIENPTGSQPVNLTNWAEGGDALAAAFGRMLGPMFEAMSKNQQANTSPSAVNDNAGAETPASKTEQGEGNGGADSTPGQPATDPNANREGSLGRAATGGQKSLPRLSVCRDDGRKATQSPRSPKLAERERNRPRQG